MFYVWRKGSCSAGECKNVKRMVLSALCSNLLGLIFANGHARAQMCTLHRVYVYILRTHSMQTRSWDFGGGRRRQRAAVCRGINRRERVTCRARKNHSQKRTHARITPTSFCGCVMCSLVWWWNYEHPTQNRTQFCVFNARGCRRMIFVKWGLQASI